MKKNRHLKPKSLIWLVNAYLILEIICFCLSTLFGSILLPLAVSWKNIECIMCFSTLSIGFFAMAIAWFCLTFKYKKQLNLLLNKVENGNNKCK